MDMTLKQVSVEIKRNPYWRDGVQASWVKAIDAHISQHAATVAKLRQMSVDMANSYDDAGDCLDFSEQLDAVLSAEPAPPAPVDIEAVREVIAALIRSGYQRENHLAVKLSAAIGDTK